MPGTEGTAAVQDTSPNLADFVGDIMGDMLTAEPETPAGAPPAVSPETPGSDGTEAAPAEASPAGAETVPDQSTPGTEPDPLDGATPFAYTVNGESRTFEGITRLKDNGGAIVEPDALALLERRLGERDHLYERSQAQFQQIEELGKLTEWRVRGANGQEQVLSGREGVEAQRLALGNAYSELRVLRDVLSDPAKIASLLLYDEQQGISANTEAIATLRTRVENEQLKAAHQVRTAMAQYGRSAAPAAPAQGYDATANAPAIVEFAITQGKLQGLTAEDRQWAAGLAPRFVRIATQEDVRSNPTATYTVGEPILDPAFVGLLQDRAKMRASTSAQVTSAADAAKRNQAAINAANAGKRPAPPARPATTPPQQPETSEHEKAEDDHFFNTMRTGAAIMRQPQGT